MSFFVKVLEVEEQKIHEREDRLIARPGSEPAGLHGDVKPILFGSLRQLECEVVLADRLAAEKVMPPPLCL